MRKNDQRAVTLLSLVLFSLTALGFSADSQVEVRKFPVSNGDTLVIQLDYGTVNIYPRESSGLEARLVKHAPDARGLADVDVLAQKQGDKIYLNGYFYNYQGQSLSVDVWAPPALNVIVWGANPDVQIAGTDGYVRIHTLTGSITAEDLSASTSLMTETGAIVFRERRQPVSDIWVESVSGKILCEVKDDLNFRGWARAGGKLKWNDEIEMDQGSLERQIGLGGPLCYAASLKGSVEFRVKGDIGKQAARPKEPPALSPSEQAPPRGQQTSTVDQPTTPSAQAPAQTGSTGPVVQDQNGTYSTGFKLKLDVDWIYLNTSVRERNTNRSVPNLQKRDFLVYEDGAPQEIGKFLETEEPFHLLLLLDVSGSTQEYLDMIKEASIGFTRQIGSEDRIAVATFNSNFQLRQDFTNDREQAADAIRRIRSGGGTAFYDALGRAVRDHVNRIQGRKAIVVFSDGVDNQLSGDPSDGSRTRFEELYRDIQEADALVYTIFLDTEEANSGSAGGGSGSGTVIDILGDILRGRRGGGRYPPARYPGGGGSGPVYSPEAYREARRQMEMIAEQTGGRMYTPNRIDDLSNAYSEIADDLRVQYTLGYNSKNPNRDGSWRKLRVAIANRPELVVRTRKGYYARAESQATGARQTSSVSNP